MARDKAKKLPKRIAGVKIPKELRKSGGELLQKLDTPIARELLAAGLVAAGTALARKAELRKAAARVEEEAEGAAEDAAELGARVASQIGGAVGAAANAALDRIFGPAKNAPETPASETTH